MNVTDFILDRDWARATKLPPSNSAPSKIDYVGYVLVPLFLVIGVTGNIITIVVMRSKMFNKFPSSYILICVSISDTVMNLLIPLNKKWVQEMLTTDIRSYSESGCQAFFWAFRTAKMTSSWFVVLICIERFAAVVLPMKAVFINTKRNAFIGIFLVYLLIGTYNAIWVPFADRIINGSCIPNTKPKGLEQVTKVLLIVGCSIYAFIPEVILIICTVWIIVKLFASRRTRQRMSVSAEDYKDPTSKTTAMLLGIIIAFVICVTPIAVGHVLTFIKNKPIFQSQDPVIVIYREIAVGLEHLNYSINFFLYVLACPSFRQMLPVIFGCREAPTTKQIQNSNDSYKSNITVKSALSSRNGSLCGSRRGSYNVTVGGTPTPNHRLQL